MPRLTKRVPSYRLHGASGLAVVTLNGRTFYLGRHGTKASKIEYDRLVSEWLQQGRTLPAAARDHELTVVEILLAYVQFAGGYYVKGGRQTSEVASIKIALRPVRELYGTAPVREFGPTALKVIRQGMVKAGLSRGTVNDQTSRIVRCFRWAVESELIDAAIPQALSMVAGLKSGRTEAYDPDPIEPVDDDAVVATLPHLPEVVADMVRLQRLTGCRPQEVCGIRPCDIDRSSDVWLYRPESHKTEHHGRKRVIPIGPLAQGVFAKYLARDVTAYCFRPIDSEAQRQAKRHAARATPIELGNRPGTNRKRRPVRIAGEAYTTDSYRRAIYRACDAAFPPLGELGQLACESAKDWEARLTRDGQLADLRAWQKKNRWAPNRLRHTAGTEIRKHFGLEAVQTVLGHASADVTQIYAERDLAKAIDVARRLG